METTTGQPPTDPPVAPPRSPGSATPSHGRALWATLVPALCLVVTAGFWWQTRAELAAMRSQQQDLIDVLDTLKGTATLDVSDAPALGADDAIVTLIEFSDYECPYCIRHFTQTMAAIDEKFIQTGRIQYVFKDFPIAQLHPGAILAHQATRCAAEQGRFWEMHTAMFTPPGTHGAEALEAKATAAGVALGPYRACMTSNRTLAGVEASVDTAARLGANGTPSFFVGLRDPATNRVRIVQAISGAHPFEEFERVITSVEARQRP